MYNIAYRYCRLLMSQSIRATVISATVGLQRSVMLSNEAAASAVAAALARRMLLAGLHSFLA